MEDSAEAEIIELFGTDFCHQVLFQVLGFGQEGGNGPIVRAVEGGFVWLARRYE